MSMVDRVAAELAKNRTLLMVHGLLLFEVAIAILLFGGPAAAAKLLGPHSHQILGLSALVPGLALLAGVMRSSEVLQIIGLAGVVLWDSTIAYLFALAIPSSPNPVLILEGDPSPVPGHPYVPFVYLNVAILALVHLVTLIRLRRLR